MPDFLLDSRPWHHAGHRVLRPFADVDAPLNISYCLTCTEYGTGRKEGAFEGPVYAFREYCGRCGRVMRYAIYNQSMDQAAGRRALAWAQARKEMTR